LTLRFIPLAQLFVASGLMIAIDALIPAGNIAGSWMLPLSITLALTGATLVAVGGKEFIKFNTTVNPINPENTTSLVTSGIYRISRNPMYLGFALVLAGLGAFLGNLSSLFVIAMFIWYITKYQIIPEENVLENKFGEGFREYKTKVRRWI